MVTTKKEEQKRLDRLKEMNTRDLQRIEWMKQSVVELEVLNQNMTHVFAIKAIESDVKRMERSIAEREKAIVDIEHYLENGTFPKRWYE